MYIILTDVCGVTRPAGHDVDVTVITTRHGRRLADRLQRQTGRQTGGRASARPGPATPDHPATLLG